MSISATAYLVTDAPRVVPPSGLEASGGEWRLDVERFAPFVESLTGLSVSAKLSDSECYRIRNRLEALVAERYRTGEWPQQVRDASSEAVAADDLFELARFFRVYHEERQTNAPTF